MLQLILIMIVIFCPLSLAAQPPPLPPGQMNTAEQSYQAALAEYNAGAYHAAIKKAHAATLVNPEHWQAWQLIGSARHAWGDTPGAISAYSRSLRFNPDNPTLRAFVDRERQRHTRAARTTEPYRRFPHNPDGFPSLGLAVGGLVGGTGKVVTDIAGSFLDNEFTYDVGGLNVQLDLRVPTSNTTTLTFLGEFRRAIAKLEESGDTQTDTQTGFFLGVGLRVYLGAEPGV